MATDPQNTIAQPQQEPVAWANPNDLQNFDMKVRTNAGPLHTVPLYTSPPARKPLTRDQVNRMLTDAEYDTANLQARWDFLNGVRQCEVAHGIKGEA